MELCKDGDAPVIEMCHFKPDSGMFIKHRPNQSGSEINILNKTKVKRKKTIKKCACDC